MGDNPRPRHIPSLLAQLDDPLARADAVGDLRAMGARAISELADLLGAPDPDLATRAADALGAVGDVAAVAPLGEAALYATPAVAARAAAALGTLPPTQAAMITLEECLDAPPYAVRREAAVALARLSTADASVLARRASAALSALRPADVVPVCSAAARRLTAPECTAFLCAAMSVDARAAVGAFRRAAEADATATVARDALYRREVLDALLRLLGTGDAALVAPLVAHVARALLARATPGDPERDAVLRAATTSLVGALPAASTPLERAPLLAAVQALGDDAIELLSRGLVDAPPERVPELATTLSELGWLPTPDARGARFWISRGAWEACLAAGDEAIGPLVEAFLSPDPEQRAEAAVALSRLDWMPENDELAVPFLLALERWDDLRALGPGALPHLADVLRRERLVADAHEGREHREEVRRRIVCLLPAVAGSAAAEVLEEVLFEDPAPVVRHDAARALAEVGALPAALVAQALEHEARLDVGSGALRPAERLPLASPLVRFALLDLLGEEPPDEALGSVLRAALLDPDEGCRQRAIELLRTTWERSPEALVVRISAYAAEEADTAPATLLEQLGLARPQDLVARLGVAPAEAAERAADGLKALASVGVEVVPALLEALSEGSPQGRWHAANLLDEFGETPTGGPLLAAYWLAKGYLDRCEACGEEAVGTLTRALPDYDWRMAGQMAAALIRLGTDPRSKAVSEVVARLQAAAEREDELVTQVLPAEEGREETITLTISHEDDRQEARRLLRLLGRLQARAPRRPREA